MSAASVNGVTTQASMIKVTTEAHPHDLLLYCGNVTQMSPSTLCSHVDVTLHGVHSVTQNSQSVPNLALGAGDGSDEDEPRYGCDLCIGGCCRDIGEPGCGVCHCCKALTELGVDDSSTCPVFSAHSMIASLECIFFFSTRSTKPRLRLLQLHVTARR